MTSTNNSSLHLHIGSDGFKDWQTLLELIQSSFAYMEEHIDPPSSMHKLTKENLATKSEVETLIYIRDNNDLIGCAFANPLQDCLYVGKVAVRDGYQGQGIGQKLMSAAKKLGQDMGYSELELQSRVELVENHRFFEKLGFYKSGETAHEGYDRPTSITMRCRI